MAFTKAPISVVVTDANGNEVNLGQGSGPFTAGPTSIVITDKNGNAVTVGAGGGGGTGTVTSVLGTANQITSDGSTTTPTVALASAISGITSIALTDTASNTDLSLANTTASILATAQSSPAIALKGTYWDGSASQVDTWTVKAAISNGVLGQSVLTLAHSGSNPSQVQFPAGTSALPGITFVGNTDMGVFNQTGTLGLYAGSATNIAIFSSATGATMQVHIVPGGNGGDGVFKICSLFAGVAHCGRLVYKNSTDAVELSGHDIVTRIQLPNVANGGGPVFPNTGLSGSNSPVVFRNSGDAANHETQLYRDSSQDALIVAPGSSSSRLLDFTGTKFTNKCAVRGYTNDAVPLSGTGMWVLSAADSIGYTSLVSYNDTGFRIQSFEHTGVTQQAQLQMDTTAFGVTSPQLLLQTPANVAKWILGNTSELITLSTSGTTTDSAANLLPANSIIEAVVARVTTTITTATDWKLGDATTAGRFSAANATLTAGTTQVGTVQADQTGAPGPRQVAAAKLRITTTGTPGAGIIRVTVFYRQFVPPTS